MNEETPKDRSLSQMGEGQGEAQASADELEIIVYLSSVASPLAFGKLNLDSSPLG